MYTIGLTGNIAVGKSTILAQLRELGAAVLDADQLVHALQAPGGAAYAPVVAAFGPQVLQSPAPDAPLDRSALAQIVFSSPARLRELEAIVHPLVRAAVQQWLAAHQAQGTAVAVLDAIKLIEGGWPALCDAVWVVVAPPARQLERLMAQRGMTAAEATMRISAQSPAAEKIAHATVVIDNGGTLDAARDQVMRAWSAIPAPTHGGPHDNA